MNITLGFSPCPNDTYMFAALVNKWIDTGDIEFSVHMEDVEQLNQWAGSAFLDVTKMSFHRSLALNDQYTLLSAGAAVGNNCGPLLIAREALTGEQILEGPVALPGEWTTAHLLFNLFYPNCRSKKFYLFSEIEASILEKDVVAGVIIHENRFTYQQKGLVKIADLGETWESDTGMPIPLGGIFAANRIPDEVKNRISSLIKESIKFANVHPEHVMPYVRQFSQEMDESVMKQHIDLYVSDFSLELGDLGRRAVEILRQRAQ